MLRVIIRPAVCWSHLFHTLLYILSLLLPLCNTVRLYLEVTLLIFVLLNFDNCHLYMKGSSFLDKDKIGLNVMTTTCQTLSSQWFTSLFNIYQYICLLELINTGIFKTFIQYIIFLF